MKRTGVVIMGLLAAASAAAPLATAAESGSVAATPAPEIAGIVPAPDWRVGSEWAYSDGYGLRVSAVEGHITTFERTDASGQWFSRHGFLRQDALDSTAMRQTIYRTVPPDSGLRLDASAPLTYQREYLSNGRQLVHATSWTVEGRETITVPAGTFDTWIIVWRTRSLQSDWTGFERWWYSPEVQHYVRMEYKYGPAPTASRVLMRYSVVRDNAAPGAPQEAPEAISRAPGTMTDAPVSVLALPHVPRPEDVAEEIIETAPAYPPLAPEPSDTEEPREAVAPGEPLQPQYHVAAVPAEQIAETVNAMIPELATGRASGSTAPLAGQAYPWSGAREGPGWVVQVGSFSNAERAATRLAQLRQAYGLILGELPHGADGGADAMHRAWIGGYATRDPADALCARLKQDGNSCFVRKR